MKLQAVTSHQNDNKMYNFNIYVLSKDMYSNFKNQLNKWFDVRKNHLNFEKYIKTKLY